METITVEFSKQDLTNILALISKSNITGADAVTVATLQLKISNILKADEKPEEEPKKEKKA